jgi:hypothetical protein
MPPAWFDHIDTQYGGRTDFPKNADQSILNQSGVSLLIRF